MSEFERCLKERRLLKIDATTRMIEKEIEGARYDLHRAEESLHNKDNKWCSIQSYYSMFHAAKALVLMRGYREKSHYCLLTALKELYVKTGEVEREFIDTFEMSMDIRHEADYGLSYDEESAVISFENARKFLHKAQVLLKKGEEKD